MQEAKELLVFIVKSPAFWATLVALVNENIKWLFPDIPDQVITAFNNFVVITGGLVVAFYAGRYSQQTSYRREALKQLKVKKVDV